MKAEQIIRERYKELQTLKDEGIELTREAEAKRGLLAWVLDE